MWMTCVNRHNGDAHDLQKVETFEFTTAAIHTQGKKAYSNTTPYRACVSARMPGCCDDVAGMGYGLHTPSLSYLFHYLHLRGCGVHTALHCASLQSSLA